MGVDVDPEDTYTICVFARTTKLRGSLASGREGEMELKLKA